MTDDLRALFLRHVCQTSDAPMGLVVARRARVRSIRDVEGREYLDLLAGMGVANVGHAHPEVVAAVRRRPSATCTSWSTASSCRKPQVRLAARLAGLLPPALSVVYFTSSGAEAVDGALKTARKATGRPRFVAFDGRLPRRHLGRALGRAATRSTARPFEPLLPGSTCCRSTTSTRSRAIDERTAAVIVEPVQAEGGVRIPRTGLPRRAAPALRRGRRAPRLRRGGHRVRPDRPALRPRALGRRCPTSSCSRRRSAAGCRWARSSARPALMRTLGARTRRSPTSPRSAAIPSRARRALAALDVLLRDRLVERAATLGAEMLRRAARARRARRLDGSARPRPAPRARVRRRRRVRALRAPAWQRGLILNWTLHRDTVVRLAPPLVLSDAEAERALAAIAAALA